MKKTQPKIAHIFFNCDLRRNHRGLKLMLETEKIEIKDEDFIVFINSSRTMFKILKGKLLVHYANGNKVLEPQVIPEIPNHFMGAEFKYTQALKKVLLAKLKRRKGGKV